MNAQWTVRTSTLLLAAVAALATAGCSLFQHETMPPPTASTSSAQEAQCEQLSSEIRTAQQRQRRAPTQSVDRNIVSAAQAKADNRIQDLQSRYDEQNCAAAALPPARAKTPPLPPAPGSPLQ